MAGCLKPKTEVETMDQRRIISIAQGSESRGIEVVTLNDSEEELVPWHAVPDVAEVVEDLASNAETGLSSSECS